MRSQRLSRIWVLDGGNVVSEPKAALYRSALLRTEPLALAEQVLDRTKQVQ